MGTDRETGGELPRRGAVPEYETAVPVHGVAVSPQGEVVPVHGAARPPCGTVDRMTKEATECP